MSELELRGESNNHEAYELDLTTTSISDLLARPINISPTASLSSHRFPSPSASYISFSNDLSPHDQPIPTSSESTTVPHQNLSIYLGSSTSSSSSSSNSIVDDLEK
jgi:hypothetical protein